MAVKAYLFDSYGTLFDVYSVSRQCEEKYPEKGEQLSKDWRELQLQYAFLSQILQQYEPFDEITKKALMAALDRQKILYEETDAEELSKAYEKLEPFEETKKVLSALQDSTVMTFSNGTHGMLQPLIKHHGLESLLGIISADEIRQYKPSPAAYQYALDKLGLNKKEIVFVSSNQWDITGAASFGFQTVWINRKEEPTSRLGFVPDLVLTSLERLPEEKPPE